MGRAAASWRPGDESGSTDIRRWVVQELVAEAVLAHEARAAAGVDRGSPGKQARALARRRGPARGGGDRIGSGEHTRSALLLRPQPRPVPPSGVPPRPTRPRLGRESARIVVRRLAEGDDMASISRRRSRSTGGAAVRADSWVTSILASSAVRSRTPCSPPRSERSWDRFGPSTAGTWRRWNEPRRLHACPSRLSARRSRPICSRQNGRRPSRRGCDARRSALAVIEPGYEHPTQPGHGFQSHRH